MADVPTKADSSQGQTQGNAGANHHAGIAQEIELGVDKMTKPKRQTSNSRGSQQSRDDTDSPTNENGVEKVQLERQITSDGRVVPGSYLDYIGKLKHVWSDMPDVQIDLQDYSYVIPMPGNENEIPNMVKSLASPIQPLLNLRKNKDQKGYNLPALDRITTSIKPGTLTLILAPPGHGKSTLLRAISGQLALHKQHAKLTSGTIRWNGMTFQEARSKQIGLRIEKLTAYATQQDHHFSTLTVRETIQFAIDNAVATPPNPDQNVLKRQRSGEQVSAGESSSLEDRVACRKMHDDKASLIIKLLGLEECADTIVGNDLMRGVSGGQKKRVTIAEMMATNARVLALDEVTNGLDAAVATDLTRSLRAWTRLSNGSAVCALQQPTPEMVDMFDDIILMSNGRIVYHGPRQQVIPYVEWLGASQPEGFDDADFLIAYLSSPQKYSKARSTLQQQHQATTRLNGSSNQTQRDSQDYAEQKEQTSPDPSEYRNDSNYKQSSIKAAQSNKSLHSEYDDATKVAARDNGEGGEYIGFDDQHHSNGTLDLDTLRNSFEKRSNTINSNSQEGLIAGWESTNIYQNIVSHVQNSQKQHSKSPAVGEYTRAQFYQKSSHAVMYHLASNLRRQSRLIGRDPSQIGPRIGQAIFLGFLVGGLFYGLPTDPGSNVARMGLILSTLAVSPWANLNELPANDEAKPVIWKQVDSGFYPASTFVLSQTVFSLPLLATETAIMSIIIYFMGFFVVDAGRFFFFWFCLFMNDLVFSIIFRIVSFISPNQFIAQQAGGPSVGMALGFAGFLITYNNIPDWLLEFYWISPFSWLSRSMAQNEFNAPRYNDIGFGANGEYGRQGDLAMDYWYMPHEFVYKWTTVPVIFFYWMVGVACMVYAIGNVRIETTFGTRRPRPSEMNHSIEQQKSSVRLDMNAMQRAETGAAAGVLPFKPVQLVWKNIFYDVKLKDGSDRRLLTDISAFCEPGECTALMGSSGAGKTTLMDVIAGRKTSGKIDGKILVNGKEVSQQVFQKMIGYVEQTDNHMPFSTVVEALTFSAALRLPTNVTAEQRKAFVSEILEILELTPIANRIIGDASVSGLSPAQTKLVTIGVELAANPSIIFLDEPTSGIDSRAALVVMRAVRRIAATGRTVLCTIHQPSFELFSMFDRLVLLKTGGTMVYNHTVGDNGKDVIQYFETSHQHYAKQLDNSSDSSETSYNSNSGFAPKHNGVINPASWMLDVLGEAKAHKLDYTHVWSTHPWSKEANDKVEELSQPTPRGSTNTSSDNTDHRHSVSDPVDDKKSRANIFTQTQWVLKREFYSYWRNSSYNLVRAMIQLALGIIFGLLYLNIVSDVRNGGFNQAAAKLNSVEGGLLMTSAFLAVLNCATALPVVAGERAVFYREQASKVYSPYAYATSLMIVEIPFTALAVLCFVVPWYYLAGFKPDGIEFCKLYLLYYMSGLIMNSMAHWLSSALPNLVISTQVLGVLYTFIFEFGGVFIREKGPGAIAVGWNWIYYMNFVPKIVNAVSMAQFGCTGPQCPTVVVGQSASRGVNGVESISDYLAYDFLGASIGSGYYAQQVGWLFLTYIIVRFFSFMSLRYVNYLKR